MSPRSTLSVDLNPRVIAATDFGDVAAELRQVGAADVEAMAQKAGALAVVLENVPSSVANLLERLMLDVGGQAAFSQGAAKTMVVLAGTRAQFERMLEGLDKDAAELAGVVRRTICNYDRRQFVIEACSKRIEVGPRPVIMGVVNVTPDSFSDGGKFLAPDRAVEHALKLVDDGADILDIGGESTRPGSEPVTAEEELRRVMPVIEALSGRTEVPISIDTRKSVVAEEALEAGAVIVNDISGLGADEKMARVVADAGAAIVVMHIQGTPQTMQQNPHYEHLMSEVCCFLRSSIQRAVESGIDEEKIMVDPGIGFGKRLEDNVELLKKLGQLRSLGRPIMVGTSRKSFIGALTGAPMEGRLLGTAVSVAMSLAAGALVFRAHDVREIAEALAVASAVIGDTISVSRENVGANN